jgi:excisionase family DNA binding protein
MSNHLLLYSRKEASRLLGISLHKLDELIRRKEIDVRRIDDRIKFHHSELDRFARGATRKADAGESTTESNDIKNATNEDPREEKQ